MDESPVTAVAVPRKHGRLKWIVATLLLIAVRLVGCRVPDAPVFKREPLVIMYDSAKEAELRSGKPLRFGLDGMVRYVETLAEPVAITEWSADHCKWEVFVATNRGCWSRSTIPRPQTACSTRFTTDATKSRSLATISVCG